MSSTQSSARRAPRSSSRRISVSSACRYASRSAATGSLVPAPLNPLEQRLVVEENRIEAARHQNLQEPRRQVSLSAVPVAPTSSSPGLSVSGILLGVPPDIHIHGRESRSSDRVVGRQLKILEVRVRRTVAEYRRVPDAPRSGAFRSSRIAPRRTGLRARRLPIPFPAHFRTTLVHHSTTARTSPDETVAPSVTASDDNATRLGRLHFVLHLHRFNHDDTLVAIARSSPSATRTRTTLPGIGAAIGCRP